MAEGNNKSYVRRSGRNVLIITLAVDVTRSVRAWIYQTPFNRIKRRGRATLFFSIPSLLPFDPGQRTKVGYSRQLRFGLHGDNHAQSQPYRTLFLPFFPVARFVFSLCLFHPTRFCLRQPPLTRSIFFLPLHAPSLSLLSCSHPRRLFFLSLRSFRSRGPCCSFELDLGLPFKRHFVLRVPAFFCPLSRRRAQSRPMRTM